MGKTKSRAERNHIIQVVSSEMQLLRPAFNQNGFFKPREARLRSQEVNCGKTSDELAYIRLHIKPNCISDSHFMHNETAASGKPRENGLDSA